MEKKKYAIKKKSVTKKNSLYSEVKPSKAITSKKQTIKNNLETDSDMESDVFLRDIKPSKKLTKIDEKIKSLRTDLKSLLDDMKTENNPENSSDNRSTNTLPSFYEKLEDIKFKEPEISEIKNFEPNFNSTPSEASMWLDETVDLLDSKSDIKQLYEDDDGDHNVSLSSNKSPPVLISNLCTNEDKNKTSFSQHRVEELIYKSFCLQNSELILSSPEVSNAEKSNSKKKQKTKPSGTRAKEECKRLRKQKKSLSRKKPVNKDVEIINLDSSLVSNKTQDASIICIDLDISNYKWDESFELEEATGFLSDVQILEEFNKKYTDEEQKSMTKLTVCRENVPEDKNDKTPSRKSWECPVCFETSKGQEIVATQCGHVFCRKCIEMHTSQINNSCPTCRFSLQDKALITLFNI